MTNSESLTLQMLKQIDRKLETLIEKVSGGQSRPSKGASSLAARAREIAALTPHGVKQTDAVELLHEDRLR
jgi:hypothetical protein